MENVLTTSTSSVSFRRRLGALLYDAIAATTVLYFAGFIPVLIAGRAVSHGNVLFTAYLLAILFGYFWLGWSRGRTLGMQAWKIRISGKAAHGLDFPESALRFACAALSLACLGLGYAAALLDRERRSWHDRLSATYLQRL